MQTLNQGETHFFESFMHDPLPARLLTSADSLLAQRRMQPLLQHLFLTRAAITQRDKNTTRDVA